MKKTSLYANGPLVSSVGYGCMSFSSFYGATTEEASIAILDRCRELDIDHLDTANVYGNTKSEVIIGTYLKANPDAREFFKIASKGGIFMGKPEDNGGKTTRNDKAYLTTELEASLTRLNVDCLEIYYLHRWDKRTELEEVTETLAGFVKAGRIKSFGFSEIAPSTLRRAAAIHPVGAVQSEYSLATRQPEMGMLQACEELDTTFVAFSPVGRGTLTDSPRRDANNLDSGFLATNPRFHEPNMSANLAYTDKFREYAADKGVAAASLAIAWTLAKSESLISIPGTRSIEHLNQVAAGGTISLSESEVAEIETVLPIGYAHGDRYADGQWRGQERYC